MKTELNFSLLAKHAEPVSFSSGSQIFAAGDPGDFVYVVKSGEVDIAVNGRIIETVGAGGIFGEMALISEEPRSASAIARSDCELVPVNQKRFTFLVQEMPFFAIVLMRVLAQRLRKLTVASAA